MACTPRTLRGGRWRVPHRGLKEVMKCPLQPSQRVKRSPLGQAGQAVNPPPPSLPLRPSPPKSRETVRKVASAASFLGGTLPPQAAAALTLKAYPAGELVGDIIDSERQGSPPKRALMES